MKISSQPSFALMLLTTSGLIVWKMLSAWNLLLLLFLASAFDAFLGRCTFALLYRRSFAFLRRRMFAFL